MIFVTLYILCGNVRFIELKNLSVELKNVTVENETLSDFSTINACRENPAENSETSEQYKVVETSLNGRLTLACHYCDEPDDYAPKNWYKKSRFMSTNVSEVELGVEDVLEQNRVYMKPDHTLVISKIERNDTGLYYCIGIDEFDEDNKFSYLVDVVNQTASVRIGNNDDWERFVNKSYTEMSYKFRLSNRSDYVELRNMGVHIEIHSTLMPWGICNGCRNIRTRTSDCRLKPSFLKETGTSELYLNRSSVPRNYSHEQNLTEESSIEEAFLLESFEISCFSLDFEKLFPNISKDLQNLGIFMISEQCYAPCKFQFKSSFLPRYKNTLFLKEGDHFTFTCPESDSASAVTWRKDGVLLEPLSRVENAFLDSFNKLHITSATEDESANYTCYVGNVRMQEINVVVEVESLVENKDLRKHWFYLGCIILICFLIYIAGIVLTWKRRHMFVEVDFSNYERIYSEDETDDSN